MLEKKVETAHVKKVKNKGGESYKFTSPGRRNVPDRLDLFPVENVDKKVVEKYVQFTECKAPGEKPRSGQIREIERLRKLGFKVNVVDSI